MATLQITTFGRPQIILDGKVAGGIRSTKARAVLYFLATVDEPTSRQLLAGLLWSDKADESARRNLRGIVHKLKSASDEPILQTTRDTVRIHPGVDAVVDVNRFEALLAEPYPAVEQLSRAAQLYRGDFLDDFHVLDAPLFDEWVLAQRERLRQQAEQTFYRLVVAYTDRRQIHQGIDCCTRLLELWPWAEEGHRQLMHLFALDGQRSAALNQYDLCSEILYEELGVEPSTETTELYDRILAGEIGAAPRERVVDDANLGVAPPFQAMARHGHFVGRQEEVELLCRWLIQPDGNHMAALVGMGGIGKSTLANRVAHQLRDHFTDGVLWAQARTTDPMDTLLSWARVYGYDFGGLSDITNRSAALRSILADKRVLIVLDDVISPARVRALLPGGPEHSVLMTTRDQGIARALDAEVLNVRELTVDDGVTLLSRIIGEQRVNAELEAARGICNELRNLPLAVEITAKRLVDRTTRRLSAMASRLHDVSRRLDELTLSDRAVRTSFLVSWESMDVELRHAFALLGLFGGRSFTPQAFASVADYDLYTAEDRLFDLDILSLVEMMDDERYRQHPLLADFAQEQLEQPEAAERRLSEYFLTYIAENRAGHAALAPEWDNVMASMAAAYRRGDWATVLKFADALTPAWLARGRYTQARQGSAWACDAAAELEERAALGRHMLTWGKAALEQTDYKEAEQLLRESLKLAHDTGQIRLAARAELELGRLGFRQTDYVIADERLTRAQQHASALEDDAVSAEILHWQAQVSYRHADYEAAVLLSEQALELQERSADLTGALRTLRLLADIDLIGERYDKALERNLLALEYAETVQDRGETAAAYYGLAVVQRHMGNLQNAVEYGEKSLQLAQFTGDRRFQATVLHELAIIKCAAGFSSEALVISQQSLALWQDLEDKFGLAYCLLYLGEIYAALDRPEEANEVWRRAREIAEEQDHPALATLQARLG